MSISGETNQTKHKIEEYSCCFRVLLSVFVFSKLYPSSRGIINEFVCYNMCQNTFPLPDILLNMIYKPSDMWDLGAETPNCIEMPSHVRVISTIGVTVNYWIFRISVSHYA